MFVKELELRGAGRPLRLWTAAGTEGARTEFTQASLPAIAAATPTPVAAVGPASQGHDKRKAPSEHPGIDPAHPADPEPAPRARKAAVRRTSRRARAFVRRREGLVIAVGVTGRMGQFTRPQRPGLARVGRPIRRVLTGGEAQIPRLGETIVRTVTVGSIDTVGAARLHADFVIAPPVDTIGLMDWRALPLVVEAGRQAVRELLAANPDLPSRLAI